ncbi:MAG TPA: hypothetical protein VFS20_15745 [Longimicrobium sp.]|nr:hypothetical protein [Longimicrobium sp.]
MHRITPWCVVLCLAACNAADREPPSNGRQTAPQPPPAPVASPQAGDSLRPDSAVADTAPVGFEEFAYATEVYDPASLSPWHEADPETYSGSYTAEFGDSGFRAVLEVRAGDGGYLVTGVLESMTAGDDSASRTPLAPVPLRLDGPTARFATPGGSATFLLFSRDAGQAPMRGLLMDDAGERLFYAKDEPEP